MRALSCLPIRSVVLAVGSLLPMAAVTLSAPAMYAQAVAPMSLDGTWQGTLHAGKDLRLVLKIAKAPDGARGSLKGVFYSIDQGAASIPVNETSLDGSAVRLNVDAIGGTYTGKMSADGNSITGEWKQGDQPMPLVLVRATAETAWAIPEPPPPPVKMDPKANPSWEIATIKPNDPSKPGFAYQIRNNNFFARGLTIEKLMTISMALNSGQIVGLPDWAKTDKWDIDAKPDIPGQPSLQQFDHAVVKLMMERYGLKYHTEKRTMTAYSLSVVKGGIKMTPAPASSGDIPGFGLPPGQVFINNATMNELSAFLQSDILDHPVVDQTGLGGARYSGRLKYQMDDAIAMKMGMPKAPPPPETGDVPPPFITALGETFGLKLESGKIPVDVIVVDSVSKPSAN